MPLFHLNLVADGVTLDDEGHDLSELDAAIRMAVVGARELIADLIVSGKTVDLRHQIKITDRRGQELHSVSFADVVRLIA